MAEQKEPLNVKLIDNLAGGEYSNAMQVAHNENEFQMFFLNVMGQSGRVVSKVMTSPGHFKRMLSAMSENLSKYEATFGTIKEIASPIEKEVGFKTND
ncbi:MAG: DUF3467 domain-containing protein [Parcubacteria group bacterium]|nr:MAG: DUF3467 domain-containing protein [Parcubacteria group bacterium]